MLGLLPFANQYGTGLSGTQALSTTFAKLGLNALSVLNGNYTAGDASVRPDVANDRMLLSPGTYRFRLRVQGAIDTAGTVSFQLRKNASSAYVITGTLSTMSWAGSSAQNNHIAEGVFTVTAADQAIANPPVANFPDPSPASFGGTGGATKSEVPVDIVVKAGSGTPTITFAEVNFTVERIG